MNEFENRLIKCEALGGEEIHVSRIVASWTRSQGDLSTPKGRAQFILWLTHLGISDEDKWFIRNYVMNGKFELEEDAKRFIWGWE